MKLDDVMSWKSTLLTEAIHKETYRPIREMAAKLLRKMLKFEFTTDSRERFSKI